MSAMIERVARAMLNDIGNGDRLDMSDPYRRVTAVQLSSADLCGMARAAIAAMREPSEAMQDAGGTAPGGCDPDCNHTVTLRPLVIWRAMIDAVLSEAPSSPPAPHREP